MGDLNMIVPQLNPQNIRYPKSLADEWPSGKGVRLSILDVVLDTSSIPSSANVFNVSG